MRRTSDDIMEKFDYYGVILDVYQRYGIRAFPIDVFSLVVRMGYDIRRYSNVAPRSYEKLMQISRSACLLSRTIFYNDEEPDTRIRFSICHELAHDLLGTEDEDLADAFAGEFLAPSPVIRTRGIGTADQLAEGFGLSIAAANRALFRGKKWTGYRLPQDHPAWQIVRWFDGEKEHPEQFTSPEIVIPKRQPPLLSKEEMERLTPEQQKKISAIRRRRRKIAKQLPEAEELTDLISDFGMAFDVLDYQRFGEGL